MASVKPKSPKKISPKQTKRLPGDIPFSERDMSGKGPMPDHVMDDPYERDDPWDPWVPPKENNPEKKYNSKYGGKK